MNRMLVCCGLLCLAGLVVGGCSKTPQVDRYFGTSYDYARESQLADPRAGVGRTPIVGMEGNIEEKVVHRYQETFDRPAPKTQSYTINVSGVSSK